MSNQTSPGRVSILLLDDEPTSLRLRATVLAQHGYTCETAETIDEANLVLDRIDVAVLDYHLGSGQFGTEVATTLRRRRPHIPIIILSGTLERFFGGAEDIHLLKGRSSTEDLLAALQSLESKRQGSRAVMDARDFFYTRIAESVGEDALVQIFNDKGTWLFCNNAAASYLGQRSEWFPGRSILDKLPFAMREWQDVLLSVPRTRDTYVDRTRCGLLSTPPAGEEGHAWSVLAFPITLHDRTTGVVLSARPLAQAERRSPTL